MSRIAKYLLIAILTFILGISAAWYVGILTKAEMLLARAHPNLVFSPSLRGCGCAWTQDYILLDGRFVYESRIGFCLKTESRPKSQLTQEKFQSIIDSASTIVKRVPSYNYFYKKEGERVELLYLNSSGEERAKILWFDGDETLLEIDAPSLEIAIGFEESKASVDYKTVE